MSPREIAARVRERGQRNPRAPFPQWTPPEPDVVRTSLDHGFLFGPAQSRRLLESWQQARPEQARRLTEIARSGLERWEIFGVPVALDPRTIDWQRGDTRWAWELNRHQFLFTFARAYVLTDESAFADRILALLDGWRDQNPYAEGVNWASALEVGLRAIAWLWTLPLLLDWGGLSGRFLRPWLTSLHEHYQYLKSHLSIYTDPTNHLIGEAAALWMLSVALPSLPEAAEQERRALGVLTREIERQVTPDGVSREQSTGYQRFVLEFYRQVAAIARRTGRKLPQVMQQRVAAMQDFLAALCGEAAEPPSIGDSDDGHAMPLPELSGCDGVFAEKDASVWLDGLRLNGRAALEAPARHRPASASLVFAQGGYCLFGSDASGSRASLLFDAGPLGLWPNASHGHADALSVQVRLGDRWFLGDPSTACYAADRCVRDLFRGTASHNTVTIDHLDQSDPLDTFKWLRPVPARLLDALCGRENHGEEIDFALGMHEGYWRLRQPVTHYRAVLCVRRGVNRPEWIIADRLEGRGHHHCSLRFHFPPGTELRGEGRRCAVAADPEGAGLQFCFCEDGCQGEQGLWSRRFGQWEPAPVLVLERKAELPLAWFTFLSPYSLAGGGPDGSVFKTSRRGSIACCEFGKETLEWGLDGKRHTFCFRAGGNAALFERQVDE